MKLKECSLKLENAFFQKQDQELIKKLQELKQREETKALLKDVSGITNDHLLEKLINLKITTQSVAALAVVPIIEVAWADGHVDLKERETILSQLNKHGIVNGSAEYDLINLWLSHKPDETLLAAWSHLVENICSKMDRSEQKEFHEALMRDTHRIANSSGGFLGFGKVSNAEMRVIAKLNASFNVIG